MTQYNCEYLKRERVPAINLVTEAVALLSKPSMLLESRQILTAEIYAVPQEDRPNIA